MGDSPRPDHASNRIAPAADRLHAAMARISQTQELLIVAKGRLAQARLQLAK